MKRLVIVGGGGFAREVLWLIEEINKAAGGHVPLYQVQGIVSKEGEGHLQGLPILGDDEWALAHLDKNVRFVLAIGDGALRAGLAERYQQAGFHPLRLVHPRAILSDEVQLGAGAIVCAGAVMTVNIAIGDFCIVNLNATVGHDCKLGDFVTLHPGAHLSGGVTIGDRCSIGTGAVVLPEITVVDDVVVGAGAAVTQDLVQAGTYVGVPARATAEEPA
jgi:sugar O-acyltransferase (sialic acid O-acetyltransferase NeuD family)